MKGIKLLASLVILIAIILSVKIAMRIFFPWDLIIWHESCFMINMLKLFHGLPIYTAMSDANSSIYAPALEYITYFVLEPFELALDIRFCRLINVFIGFIGAVGTTLASVFFIKETKIVTSKIWKYATTFGLALLIIFHNYTSASVHPDNLHILHAVFVLLLCFYALKYRNFGLAIISTCLAGTGVLIKQSEVLVSLAPLIVYTVFRLWNWYKLLIIFFISCFIIGTSFYLLWQTNPAYLYTFIIPSSYEKIFPFQDMIYFFPMEMFFSLSMVLLAVVAFLFFWKIKPFLRKLLICWLIVSFLASVINVSIFLWVLPAWWNDLIIINVLCLIIIWPFLLYLTEFFYEKFNSKYVILANALVFFVIIYILFMVFPRHHIPHPGHYKYASKVENMIRKDLKAGENVYVDNGAMFLVRAGFGGVPLDAKAGMFELIKAGLDQQAKSRVRFNAGLYNRLYINNHYVDYEPFSSRKYLFENYEIRKVIPKAPASSLRHGFQPGYMGPCFVMDLK